MLTASHWAANSQVFASNISSDSMNFIYLCLITAILILIHSAFINKLQMSTIRFWTDGSCWSTVFASAFLIIDSKNSNVINDAFYIDLCVYAIFGTTVQLCDNYMTFTRYLIAYPKTTQRFKVFVNLYIWLLLISTYLPYETILPCFVDTNSDIVAAANTITAGYIFMTSYLSYNLFFSYKFWRVMRSKNTFDSGSDHKLLILGIKNLAHIFISSVGVILQGIEFTYGFSPGGCMASFFTVNIALHFLFNWKIEKSKFPFIPDYLRSRGSVVFLLQSGSSSAALRTDRKLGSIIMSRQHDGLSFIDHPPSRKSSTATIRPSKTFSMFLGRLSVKYDGIVGFERAGEGEAPGPVAANQSPSQLDNASPDYIMHTLCEDSPPVLASNPNMDKVMRQSSRDSNRGKDRGSYNFRNSIKEEDEIFAFDEKSDAGNDPKGSTGTLKHTMSLVLSNLFSNKIHADSTASPVHRLSTPNNNNSNSNNKQARYSLSAMTTTASSSLKKRDLDASGSGGHAVKVVRVIERNKASV